MNLILPNQLTIKQVGEYMKKIHERGYDCYFKTIVDKDKGTSEVHIIVEERSVTIINTRR